jgi:hypothetical protein
MPEQRSADSAHEAEQGAEAEGTRSGPKVEAEVWTDRMMSALVNGVKGGEPNAFFARVGLFATHPAWLAARHP